MNRNVYAVFHNGKIKKIGDIIYDYSSPVFFDEKDLISYLGEFRKFDESADYLYALVEVNTSFITNINNKSSSFLKKNSSIKILSVIPCNIKKERILKLKEVGIYGLFSLFNWSSIVQTSFF